MHRCPAAAFLDRPPACHNPVGAGGVVLDKALVDTLYNFLGSSKVQNVFVVSSRHLEQLLNQQGKGSTIKLEERR